jgi:predicted RNA-binding Zn ribbon-like protein
MATAPKSDVTPASPARQPAPGELDVVLRFINTADVFDEEERLVDLAALRRWLVAERLIGRGDRLREGDLDRAISVREALRGMLAARHEQRRVDPRDLRVLNAAAGSASLKVQFHADGAPALTPAGSGLDKAFGSLLAIIECARSDGTWSRLKVCAADDCAWAFYDSSKNRSAAWCSMASCGNRVKARAFRERHRTHRAARGA